jgi:hypothetical protein
LQQEAILFGGQSNVDPVRVGMLDSIVNCLLGDTIEVCRRNRLHYCGDRAAFGCALDLEALCCGASQLMQGSPEPIAGQTNGTKAMGEAAGQLQRLPEPHFDALRTGTFRRPARVKIVTQKAQFEAEVDQELTEAIVEVPSEALSHLITNLDQLPLQLSDDRLGILTRNVPEHGTEQWRRPGWPQHIKHQRKNNSQ